MGIGTGVAGETGFQALGPILKAPAGERIEIILLHSPLVHVGAPRLCGDLRLGSGVAGGRQFDVVRVGFQRFSDVMNCGATVSALCGVLSSCRFSGLFLRSESWDRVLCFSSLMLPPLANRKQVRQKELPEINLRSVEG